MEKIRLQGIGWFNAVPANELRIGDIVLHNFGYKSTVTDICLSANGKSVNYTLRGENGSDWKRRTTPTRLFAVVRVN